MTRKLLLATRNQKKKKELQDILKQLEITIVTLDEIPGLPEIEEDGATFSENAIKKAVTTAAASGMPCLADDSGLVVDALNGQPGIYSARFAGEVSDDLQNNQKLQKMMAGIEDEARNARFVCVIAVSDAQGKFETVEGKCEGKIAFETSGEGGFGYDPLFIPDGFTCSFAELSPKEKNLISHRGKALQKAKPLIMELFLR